MILKHAKAGFTAIPNWVIEDRDLSCHTKIAIACILSLPNEEPIKLDELRPVLKLEGNDLAWHKVIKELESPRLSSLLGFGE